MEIIKEMDTETRLKYLISYLEVLEKLPKEVTWESSALRVRKEIEKLLDIGGEYYNEKTK